MMKKWLKVNECCIMLNSNNSEKIPALESFKIRFLFNILQNLAHKTVMIGFTNFILIFFRTFDANKIQNELHEVLINQVMIFFCIFNQL